MLLTQQLVSVYYRVFELTRSATLSWSMLLFSHQCHHSRFPQSTVLESLAEGFLPLLFPLFVLVVTKSKYPRSLRCHSRCSRSCFGRCLCVFLYISSIQRCDIFLTVTASIILWKSFCVPRYGLCHPILNLLEIGHLAVQR